VSGEGRSGVSGVSASAVWMAGSRRVKAFGGGRFARERVVQGKLKTLTKEAGGGVLEGRHGVMVCGRSLRLP